MIATFARDPSSLHYTVANVRTYDAWGGIRSGSANGNPAQRYCASLGHRADDETGGLISMRARYYEPWTGRFVSEDPKRAGANWFRYCSGDPVNSTDSSGEEEDQPDSFDPVYESLEVLSYIEDASMYLAGYPLGWKGLVYKGAIRTLFALSSKYAWVKNFLRSRVWKTVGRFTRTTSGSMMRGYYWWLAVGGTFALAAGTYLEILITARHLAWYEFCFGDEG